MVAAITGTAPPVGSGASTVGDGAIAVAGAAIAEPAGRGAPTSGTEIGAPAGAAGVGSPTTTAVDGSMPSVAAASVRLRPLAATRTSSTGNSPLTTSMRVGAECATSAALAPVAVACSRWWPVRTAGHENVAEAVGAIGVANTSRPTNVSPSYRRISVMVAPTALTAISDDEPMSARPSPTKEVSETDSGAGGSAGRSLAAPGGCSAPLSRRCRRW